jgi:hypothetical protein
MGLNIEADVKPGDAVRVGSTWHRVAKVTVPQPKAPKKKKSQAQTAGAAAPLVVKALNPNTPGCIIELVDPYTGEDLAPQLSYAGGVSRAGCTITMSAPYAGVVKHPAVLYSGTPGARPWQPLRQVNTNAIDASTEAQLRDGDVGKWDTTMLYKMLVGVSASPWAEGRAGGPAEATADAMRQAITTIKDTRNGVCHVSSSRVVTIDRLNKCVASCDAFIEFAFPDTDKRARWSARRRELSENHGTFDGRLLDNYTLELRRIAASERLNDRREGIKSNLKRQNGVALADAFRMNVVQHQQRCANGTRAW